MRDPRPNPPQHRQRLRIGLALGLAAVIATTPLAAQVTAWITTSDHALRLAPVTVSPDVGNAAAVEIAIDSAIRHQRIVGFGASVTDASAWLIQHRLDEAQRAALLRELFGRDGGIGLELTRLTIGASDFSRTHYSLDDLAAGESDPQLRHFSIEANRAEVLPVMRAALAVNPDLLVMASPWSAPAWMKTSGSLVGGSLKRRHYDAFARYLLRYVDEYAAAGVPIFALTLQNEPSFEPADYPGMRLSASQRARLIGEHLGPRLEARGGTPILLEWDHNWDMPQEPLAVLGDERAARHIAGVAWHCYGGDVSAQSFVREAHPDKDVYLTECSGGDWEPVKSGGLTLVTRDLIIRGTRHWARGVLFWNLALDQEHGPHLGGCGNCRGVVSIDAASGEVTRSDDYYALAHASRFVRRDAQRLGSSEAHAGIDNVAFRNADDGSRVLIVSNSEPRMQRIRVREGATTFEHALPPRSIATFVWPEATRAAP